MSEPTEADIAEAIALAEAERDDVDKARDLLAIMLPSREDGTDWPLAEGIRALHDQWREADRRAIRAFEREFAATCHTDRLRLALERIRDCHVPAVDELEMAERAAVRPDAFARHDVIDARIIAAAALVSDAEGGDR